MFNKRTFLYVGIASIFLGSGTLIFPFNLAYAQSAVTGAGFDTFVITLEDWGGIAGIHIDRVYNSYSETLTIADDDVRQTYISKNDSRIENLKNTISNSSFFDTGPKHGDPTACCDLTHSTLSISMAINGTQISNTVYWHEASDPIIADELNRITSEFRSLP